VPCASYHLRVLLVVALAALPVSARGEPAAVESVRVVPADGGATVEILSTAPLTPQVETVENPLRLVIDLPNSNLNTVRKRIAFRNAEIKGVRMSQYQAAPAVARIVLDLTAPVRYSWDGLGNRLNIRVHADIAATAKPARVPAVAPETEPIAVPYSEGSSGTLVEAGRRVGSGSSITATDQTAVLRLTRGGEVRVCPGTTLSVATSPNGQDLMLGMNTGAIETHYHLEESSDSILTPDFRIVLPGPGEFNLAVKSDPHGDTCLSSLAGSNSSVVVAELLGNGTYEVKPEQQVLFRQGRMQSVEMPLSSCGCPPPQEPVLRAASDPASVVAENKTVSRLSLANSNEQPSSTTGSGMRDGGEKPGLVPASSSENSNSRSLAEVTAPLVFNAKEFARMRAQTPPELSAKVIAMPLSAKPADPLPPLLVLPPTAPKPRHRGFLGRLFRSIF
jgi:AMIN domain